MGLVAADEVVGAASVAQGVHGVVEDLSRGEDSHVAQDVVQRCGRMGGGEEQAGVHGGGADGVAAGVCAGHAVFGVDGDELGSAGGDQVRELAQGGAGAAQGVLDGGGVGGLAAGLDGPPAVLQGLRDPLFVPVSYVRSGQCGTAPPWACSRMSDTKSFLFVPGSSRRTTHLRIA